MVQILKPLVIKVKDDTDKKYIPKDITTKEWYEVIGINTWTYKDQKEDRKEEMVTVIKYLVINDRLELTQISSRNCQVCIKGEKNREGPGDRNGK